MFFFFLSVKSKTIVNLVKNYVSPYWGKKLDQ